MPLAPDAPPPIGPRSLAIAVAMQGRDAGEAGLELNACPYGPARPYSRRAWVAGWVEGCRRAGRRLPDGELVDDVAPWPGDTPA